MTDLTRAWPFGLDGKRWWLFPLLVLVLLALTLPADAALSQWATHWPRDLRRALAVLTHFGDSAWYLYPSGLLCLAAALLGLASRRPLTRLLWRQLTGLFAFIFFGIGLPSLFTTIAKRLAGRGRPVHLDDFGPFSLHPNWWDWSQQSFPSGHTTTIFALAAVVGFLLPRWFGAALLLAIVVGVSRVSTGAHYPSDVLAGAVVGFLGAHAVRLLFVRRGWLFRRRTDGGLAPRPLAALRRYIALRRRGNAPDPLRDRP